MRWPPGIARPSSILHCKCCWRSRCRRGCRIEHTCPRCTPRRSGRLAWFHRPDSRPAPFHRRLYTCRSCTADRRSRSSPRSRTGWRHRNPSSGRPGRCLRSCHRPQPRRGRRSRNNNLGCCTDCPDNRGPQVRRKPGRCRHCTRRSFHRTCRWRRWRCYSRASRGRRSRRRSLRCTWFRWRYRPRWRGWARNKLVRGRHKSRTRRRCRSRPGRRKLRPRPHRSPRHNSRCRCSCCRRSMACRAVHMPGPCCHQCLELRLQHRLDQCHRRRRSRPPVLRRHCRPRSCCRLRCCRRYQRFPAQCQRHPQGGPWCHHNPRAMPGQFPPSKACARRSKG